jgi:mRNA interferase MazF
LKRGNVVIVAAGGGFGGKPRRAVVLQADQYDSLETVVLALFTSELSNLPSPLRPRFEPSEINGLVTLSELMLHVIITVRRERIGSAVGVLSAAEMARIDQALIAFLGLAD